MKDIECWGASFADRTEQVKFTLFCLFWFCYSSFASFFFSDAVWESTFGKDHDPTQIPPQLLACIPLLIYGVILRIQMSAAPSMLTEGRGRWILAATVLGIQLGIVIWIGYSFVIWLKT